MLKGEVRGVLPNAPTGEQFRALSAAIAQVGEVVFVIDANQRIRFVNPAFSAVTGYPADRATGAWVGLLWAHAPQDEPVDRAPAFSAEQAVNGAWCEVLTGWRVDGSAFQLQLTVTPLTTRGGRLSGFVCSGRDVRQLCHGQGDRGHGALHDQTTGLPNYPHVVERLDTAIAGAEEAREGLAVFLVSIYDFRHITASYGVNAANRVLGDVADRLRQLDGGKGLLGKVGTDEFVLATAGGSGEDAVNGMAKRILTACNGMRAIGNGESLYVGVSIGSALYPDDGASAERLLQNAASAVREANDGRAVDHHRYRSGQEGSLRSRIARTTELRRAVAEEQFTLHYQPIFSVRTGRVEGVEALLRWQHPGGEILAPGAFIDLMERAGLLGTVERWAIREACQQLARWRRAGLGCGRMHINVSAREINRPDFVAYLYSVLRETDPAPGQVELEITESVFLDDDPAARNTLHELHELGVRIALDDFGSGFSSFAYLRYMLVDTIKIDHSFVRDVTTTDGDAAIIRAIVSLARSLDLGVIAEGVEEASQAGFLRQCGCDLIQGYWAARALPSEAMQRLLSERRTLDTAALGTKCRSERPTLMIVDDEPNVLRALRRELRAEPWDLVLAHSGPEALETMALQHVDVVLCDQRMPEMTGTELLKRIRQMYPDAVRLIMSAHADASTVADAVNEGAVFRFVPKPWQSGALKRDLKEAFTRAVEAQARGPAPSPTG